jgi:hypothetical protein
MNKTTRPWFACPVEAWHEIATALIASGQPWSRSTAIADLRWHADQVEVGRKDKLPGVPYFQKRWGWSQRQARKLIKVDVCDWVDSHRTVTGQLVDSHRTVPAKANANNGPETDSHRTAGGQSPDSSRTVPDPLYARGTQPQQHNTQTHSDPLERETSVAVGPTPQIAKTARPSVVATDRASLSRGSSIYSPVSSHPYSKTELVEALGLAASAITGQDWCPDGDPTGVGHTPQTLRGKEGWPLFHLLEGRGWPDLDLWLEQVRVVARAARECPYPLFSNDIRGDNWASKADSSRSIKTIADGDKWLDRLKAALQWDQAAPPRLEIVTGRCTAADIVSGDRCRGVLGLVESSVFFAITDPLRLRDHWDLLADSARLILVALEGAVSSCPAHERDAAARVLVDRLESGDWVPGREVARG